MEKKRDTIIIVDDDATNLAIGRSALEDEYDVFTALSGDKLFRILEKVTPDMILLDIEMPGMSGYDVMGVLKESEKYAGIPVVFVSGHTDPESRSEALNMGAVGYIVKPFSRDLLNDLILGQLKSAD